LLVNTAPVAPSPAKAPSAAAILFEQWWQASLFSPNPAARAASAALQNVPASLHEAPALPPPPDRVAALLTGETRRTAAERASLLLATAELRPVFDEWGNELCTCLNAG
jgi:hypothetical protein